MPQVVPTHVNAHRARIAELRAQAHQLNGEADQLEEYVRSLEGEPQDEAKQEQPVDKKSNSVAKPAKGDK